MITKQDDFIRKLIREELKSINENYTNKTVNIGDIYSENDNFWKWFGNSKVVNNDGKPMIVYHGTNKKFNVFKYGEFGFHLGTYEQANNIGSIILPCYLKMENPLYTIDFPRWEGYVMSKILNKYDIISDVEMNLVHKSKSNMDKKLKEILINKGYDGFTYDNSFEGIGKSYIVFKSNQIKSVENDGTWDIGDENIYS